MSQTNLPIPPVTAPAGPVAAPHGPRERRVRFGHLALAIALIVVGALGAATLVTLVAAKGAYLALARDVDYGARIAEDDLVVVQIGNPPGLDPVPASKIERVVGNYATMPLAAGTLLTDAHVTGERFPADGEVRLGITVPADRLPVEQVRAGNVVLLVDTGQGGPGSETPTSARTWEGIVLTVSDSGSGNNLLGGGRSRETTFDVIVAEPDAPIIAALAANNQLSVAVLPGQPGG